MVRVTNNTSAASFASQAELAFKLQHTEAPSRTQNHHICYVRSVECAAHGILVATYIFFPWICVLSIGYFYMCMIMKMQRMELSDNHEEITQSLFRESENSLLERAWWPSGLRR